MPKVSPEFRLKKSSGGGRSPIWMTIYADMMTNLMLFFLMLYALTRVGAGSKSAVEGAFKETFTKIGEQRREYIEQETEDKRFLKKIREGDTSESVHSCYETGKENLNYSKSV